VSWVTSRDGTATATVRPPDPDFPKTVGKYRILFELGRGGMATVYLAVTQGTAGVSKLVVLKALHQDQDSDGDGEALGMFLDEARLAVQLNHGNLVQTYEIGEQGNRHVIVMEYLEGQSLAHVLRRGEKKGSPLPLPLHLRVIVHVLEGLHYTHELRGYDGTPLQPVHRDVSPQNVFVTYDGRTKVLDFGIAKATTSTTHTATGLLKGKISYMAPEQMAGEAVDRRADVYAVGCMLWAAATGRKLWKDAQEAHVMRDVLDGDVPRPTSENPSCDPELERIVMKALARRPEDRYGSALALQEDLERFCEARGFHDRPRELARFVSELFADVRSDLKTRIEQELARVESVCKVVRPEPEVTRRGAKANSLTVSTKTVSASTLSAPTQMGTGPRQWLLIGLGLLGLASAGFVLTRRHVPRTAAALAVVAPSQSAKPEAPSLAAPATVKILLRSTPATAQLFLDDKPVEGNPAQEVFPQEDRVHVLRAELAGHCTASAEFATLRDETVEISLEKLVTNRSSSKKPNVTAAPAAGRQAAASSNDCAQPFFVGPDGIKKIKPKCL
jgi:serine/threonine-protein kinase